jgi:pimeloyl-ACP methyl ester carboxylesterase
MWRAIAFSNGEWRQIEIVAREDKALSPDASLKLASEVIKPPYRGLLRYFEQEAKLQGSFNYIGRDAIEHWGDRAETENKHFNRDSPGLIEFGGRTLALIWQDKLPSGREPLNPISLAWHDRSFFLLALTGEEERVLVEYVPTDDDAKRETEYRRRYAQHQFEKTLEWRGYFGRESAIVDNWQAMRRQGNGYIASFVGAAGYVLGSVVSRLSGSREPLYTKDPTSASRLAALSDAYPRVATAVPDLVNVNPSPIKTGSAVVFVHGTLSCGLQGLKDLYPTATLQSGEPQAQPRHVYRYEHDTFASVRDNAAELASLIRDKLDTARLLIAAHSRGGLVARLAKIQLTKDNYPGQIAVYTFGTPHLGTPLVHMGRNVLNALFTVGEHVAGAIPLSSSLVKAFSYVYRPSQLPPGIEVMDERSESREMLNMADAETDVTAWGASFDLNRSGSGFGTGTTGFLLGALRNFSHDLVVPTVSALGCGTAQPVLTCSHTQYFLDAEVRSAIRAFEPPLPDSGWLVELTKPQRRRPPTIIHHQDSVTISGIHVPKTKAIARLDDPNA